jgi:hypothetical protein
MNDRVDEARTILDRLHSDPSDPENEYARSEFYQIQKQIAIDRTLGSSWVTMFRKPSYRKRAFLAIGTTFFIQCSGVLVINSMPSGLLSYLPANVCRLWPNSLREFRFLAREAVVVSGSVAHVCPRYQHYGHPDSGLLPTEQVHRFRHSRLHDDFDHRSCADRQLRLLK